MWLSRPKPILDYILIEKLANLGCTEYEIAYAIGYTPEHFSVLKKKDKLLQAAIDRGSNGIKISIRRAQLQVAMPDEDADYAGNPTMLIWLGKQYLHQSDRVTENSNINLNVSTDTDLNAKLERILESRNRGSN
jgi:hypothetical protein